MRSFKDLTGRTWSVAVNVTTIRRIRDTLGLDLLSEAGAKAFETLAGDPVRLVDCLYVACLDECKAKDVTDEQFGAALAGDCIEAARDALFEELVDFFPKRQRGVMANLLATLREQEQAAGELIQKKVSSDRVGSILRKRMSAQLANLDKTLDQMETEAGSE